MAKLTQITEEQKEVFIFLNDLRDSGETNMMGAAAHITFEFGYDKSKAKDLLFQWFENFNSKGYEHLEVV